MNWDDFEILEKGRKDAMKMYPPEHQPHAKEHVDWAYSKLPNENWSLWSVRNHRTNPASFTPDIKDEVESYASMAHLPEFSELRFDKQDTYETGLKKLKDAEDKYNERIKTTTRHAEHYPETKSLIDFGDGWSWQSLGVGGCNREAAAMGHCGNQPSKKPGDNVISLRKEYKLRNQPSRSEPYLTFIENNGLLGEMKGRANEKPTPEYHGKIAELLKLGYIPVGGGYLPTNNFHIDDLPENLYQEVKAKNPNVSLKRKGDSPNFESLMMHPNSRIHVELATHPNLDPASQKKLYEMAKSPDFLGNDRRQSLFIGLSQNKNLAGEIQSDMYNIGKGVLQGTLASTEINSQHLYNFDNLMRNPSLTPELQHQIVNDRKILGHAKLSGFAANENLTPEVQTKLYNDLQNDPHDNDYNYRKKEVAMWILQNKKLAPAIQDMELNRMAKEVDDIGTIYNSPDNWSILRVLARNPNLTHENAGKVWDIIKNEAYRFDTYSYSGPHKAMEELVNNPNLPVSVQTDIYDKGNESLRNKLALSPKLDVGIVKKIIENKEQPFVAEVMAARHPAPTPELTDMFLAQDNSRILKKYSDNPNLDTESKAKLYEHVKKWIPDDESVRAGIDRLSADDFVESTGGAVTYLDEPKRKPFTANDFYNASHALEAIARTATDSKLQALIAQDTTPKTAQARKEMASSVGRLGAKAQKLLVQDPDKHVRRTVATYVQNLSPDAQNKLFNDEDPVVALRLMKNGYITQETRNSMKDSEQGRKALIRIATLPAKDDDEKTSVLQDPVFNDPEIATQLINSSSLRVLSSYLDTRMYYSHDVSKIEPVIFARLEEPTSPEKEGVDDDRHYANDLTYRKRQIMGMMARNKNLSSFGQSKLVESDDFEVNRFLAQNNGLTEENQLKMYNKFLDKKHRIETGELKEDEADWQHESFTMAHALSSNGNLSNQIIEAELARPESQRFLHMKEVISRAQKLSPKIQQVFAVSDDPEHQYALLDREELDPQAFIQLAHSQFSGIKRQLVGRLDNTSPPEARAALLLDPDTEVADEVAYRVKYGYLAFTEADQNTILTRGTLANLRNLTLFPNLAPNVIETLANHRDTTVRQAVASNKDAKFSPKTYAKLVKDKSKYVREAIKYNVHLYSSENRDAILTLFKKTKNSGDRYDIKSRVKWDYYGPSDEIADLMVQFQRIEDEEKLGEQLKRSEIFDERMYLNYREILNVLVKSEFPTKKESSSGVTMDPHAYRDSFVPSVGNLYAFKQFVKENPSAGIWIDLDINSFGALNKEHGVEKGNGALQELFKILAQLSEEFDARVFRVHGDQAKILVADTDTAEEFTEHLKEQLESGKEVDGTKHKLSVCTGVGFNPEHAEKALEKAKDTIRDENKNKKFRAGEEPVVVVSFLHEPPPPNWHPFSGPSERVEAIVPSGLKLQHPLKS